MFRCVVFDYKTQETNRHFTFSQPLLDYIRGMADNPDMFCRL